ncbi:MAG: ferritin-like domain-containing protein [Planctomycetota bacterium]|nr:ferritin-like domain-containing protein [Planctomycetota bacterium]
MAATTEEVIELLKKAYSMELETVTNYLANSINLDGVRAEEIKKALAADVSEEIGHAQVLAARIKQIGGTAPGSADLNFGSQVQPPKDTCDVVAVIKGVIQGEEAACALYNEIIKATDGTDYVTQDMCITLLASEEEHLVLFRGYLKEYEREA